MSVLLENAAFNPSPFEIKNLKHVCRCTLKRPSDQEILDTAENESVARFYAQPTVRHVSMDERVDWVVRILTDHHDGAAFDVDRKEVRFNGTEICWRRDRLLYGSFGEDAGGNLSKYCERAHRPFKRRLNRGCMSKRLVLEYAIQVFECITEGPCSKQD